MQIDQHVVSVTKQLEAVAALGDERAREVAAAVATAAAPAVRLAILAALAGAVEDANATLMAFPGAPMLMVRLDAEQIRLDVQAGAPAEPPPASPRADDTDTSARISLRLPESLKTDVEAAAARDGVSVNSWLVRATEQALQPGWPGAAGWSPWTRWADPSRTSGQHITGWING